MFVQVVRSIPMNDAAAVTAVRQWKFSPALYNRATDRRPGAKDHELPPTTKHCLRLEA
jgi:hypothetical protein